MPSDSTKTWSKGCFSNAFHEIWMCSNNSGVSKFFAKKYPIPLPAPVITKILSLPYVVVKKVAVLFKRKEGSSVNTDNTNLNTDIIETIFFC